jgi:hypothetical protein
MRAILGRLKRLEDVRAGEQRHGPLQLELGYLKELPLEYAGPRHTATVGQLPNGHFLWEERAGSAPLDQNDVNDRLAMRIILVGAKDGRPVPIENFDELESQNRQRYCGYRSTAWRRKARLEQVQ